MMRVVTVDADDKPIGIKLREDITRDDLYRASAIWITNPRDEILIAQRAFVKKHSPGLWGTAVAGTFEEGEEYFDNALKEASEELGLTIPPHELIEGPKWLVEGTHRFFCQWYSYRADIPIASLSYQPEEVAAARWISADELRTALKEKPHEFVGRGDGRYEELISFGLSTR